MLVRLFRPTLFVVLTTQLLLVTTLSFIFQKELNRLGKVIHPALCPFPFGAFTLCFADQ